MPSLLRCKARYSKNVFCSLLLGLCIDTAVARTSVAVEKICVPAGSWVASRADGNEILPAQEFIADLARQPIVLLGESHDSAEHHRWQLQTIAALFAQHPNMVLGFEMFPRRVQGALDRWVAGQLSEAEFLQESDWAKVWSYDPGLYLPLFHFARMNNIPMLALNVDRKLISMTAEKGWDAVPVELREGVSKPAAASQDYIEELAAVFQAHGHGAVSENKPFDVDDPGFRRFTEGQLTWDRAMAEAIHTVAQQKDAPLVVGIMGAGHVMHGFGVPHQLKKLGGHESTVLIPWDRASDCADLTPNLADAVFGLNAPQELAIEPPRLGILLEEGVAGVQVQQVVAGSIAEASGILEQDILIEIAEQKVGKREDVTTAVQRQAPGTWLPLRLRRGDKEINIVAKFPARQ